MRRYFFCCLTAFPFVLAICSVKADSPLTSTFLISRGLDGGPALMGARSTSPSISGDGRYAAFVADAINLGVRTRVRQVWVRDRLNGQLRLASRSAVGSPADQDCAIATIGAGGRYVVFTSRAANLGAPPGLAFHVFLHDLDLESASFTYGNAGHPPPILVEPDGRYQELRSTGTVLAVAPEQEWEERTVRLAPGSVLALFTDGVTEARRRGEMWGLGGVRSVIEARVREHASNIASAIFDGAAEFAGGHTSDDVAIVVIRRA